MINFDSQLHIYTSSLINNQTIPSGFSTKVHGDARSTENLTRFFKNNNINYSSLVRPKQTHSTNISIIKSASENEDFLEVPDCDGVITTEKNILLTVQTADCVPVIFTDQKKGIIGISHQGWKGTLGRLAQKMIKEFHFLGSKMNDIRVAIGPSIHSCCYELFGERLKQFQKEFSEYDSFIEQVEDKMFLNLARLNFLQLQEVGIEKSNIDSAEVCTHCAQNHFWSYKRDTKEEFGQMFHFVVRN